ncbi:hypothetical protein ACF0H5_024144 [Mactra antiquata]
METTTALKDDSDLATQLAMAGVSNVWSQAAPLPAPQAHMSMSVQSATDPQLISVVPPPAHAHPSSTNSKPPDTFLDKNLLDAAAFLDGKAIKTVDSSVPAGDNQNSIPWGIQQQLLQQYGHFMLEKMLNKHNETGSGPVATATITTDTEELPQSLVTNSANNPVVSNKNENSSENIEAQRDVYRRMLNYSMSSTLAQQYYLSQYGYNYLQERTLFSKADSTAGMSATTTTTVMTPNQVTPQEQLSSQLPSIDSVLLNLSTKKPNGKPSPVATSHPGAPVIHPSSTSMQQNVQAYGLQALANAAIGADHKGFGEPDHDRKDGQKSELEDVTDTDSSNMSPSDSSASQIMSPPRNAYSHIPQDGQHLSIPAAHSHQYQSIYQNKNAAMGTLPSIQHFSAMGKTAVQKTVEPPQNLQLPVSSGIKPSDLVAAAMKLKVEPSEEKEIADRTIQEQIAAHQLNAVQQQVQDLTAGVLASSNIDAAALLAKLQASNLETELHRFYDHDNLQQQEPMELTSDMSPGKTGSRRKSRGRPTSIESLRDPLARQSSTSSLGANTSVSGDCEDRTYDCEICGKQFSHNDRLRRHRKIHTAEKPYKCDICGKGFKEKCNLKHHRFIHTGEKPYKCETCGKSFNQRSSLKTHQKVHTGEKPFRCELCEKPFAQKYLLRQHMKKHIELNMTPSQQ